MYGKNRFYRVYPWSNPRIGKKIFKKNRVEILAALQRITVELWITPVWKVLKKFVFSQIANIYK